MNPADVGLIVNGVVELAAIGAGTAVCFKLADRLRVVNPVTRPATVIPEAQPSPQPLAGALPRPLPPQTAQRQDKYKNRRRRDGETAASAAEFLGITARTTARDYESRYLDDATAGGAAA